MLREWLRRCQEGQALSEYVLATAFVVVVAAFWLVLLSDAVESWHQALLRALQG